MWRVVLPALLACIALVPLAPATPAFAQADFFSFLRPPAPVPQAPRNRNNNGWWPGFGFQPRQAPAPSEAPQAAPKKREPPAEPEGTVYASADAASQGKRQPPTQFALVLGDRMGGQLAQGLADAYVPDRARLAIVEYTVDDSGYLSSPIDWIAKAPPAIANGRPNVTVLALGGEDLKPITEGDQQLEPLTDRWIEAYSRRVDEVLAALREKAGRVIVVGVAPAASPGVSADYERLNEILRARAARAGLPFVSVWDGFVDEEGKYLATGPAVDGQRRRLRLADGVRFTRAGGRKLAFFVQKDLNRLLEDPAKPAAPADGASPALSLAGAPVKADAKADARALPAAIPAAATAVPAQAAARALRDGVSPPAVRGRADDFSWPPPSAEPVPPPQK
ncbi:GDSL-type esterase/lipase family protein [Xanthobacter sp. V0B-10]|uniref:SGNH/GDSL hydrolase family protein n=1 Tax=Xanthobacter albus TaxID=3119929 RepID=UPI00372A25D0